MKFLLLILISLSPCTASWFAFFAPSKIEEPFEMTETFLRLSKAAGEASLVVSEKEKDIDTTAYDFFEYFTHEPDQAMVVAVDGFCHVAFRGTILTSPADVSQVFRPGFKPACDVTNPEECCQVRAGFDDAYNAPFRASLEASIRTCLETHASCEEGSCLVLTGYSQGASIAGVASLYLASLKPLVITFGEMPSIEEGECSLASPESWWRYVNTYSNVLGTSRIGYDMFAVLNPFPAAEHVGHMIVLPADNSTGFAYLGLNPTDPQLQPASWQAHDLTESFGEMDEYHPGYIDHFTFLLEATTEYPVLLNGYVEGSLCTENRECQSGDCSRRLLQKNKRCV